ncbi:hypothetical protein FKP32DRAFT_116987 [Trametes sanguinea]|nr:hypothetical protein FKP32DRAFT_116987 [Trametes sanguinea]
MPLPSPITDLSKSTRCYFRNSRRMLKSRTSHTSLLQSRPPGSRQARAGSVRTTCTAACDFAFNGTSASQIRSSTRVGGWAYVRSVSVSLHPSISSPAVILAATRRARGEVRSPAANPISSIQSGRKGESPPLRTTAAYCPTAGGCDRPSVECAEFSLK